MANSESATRVIRFDRAVNKLDADLASAMMGINAAKAVEPTGTPAKPSTPAAAAKPSSQSNQPAADAVIEAAERAEDPEEQDDVQISKKRTRDEFEAQSQGEAVAQEIIQSQQSNTKRLKVENQISSPSNQAAEQAPAQPETIEN